VGTAPPRGWSVGVPLMPRVGPGGFEPPHRGEADVVPVSLRPQRLLRSRVVRSKGERVTTPLVGVAVRESLELTEPFDQFYRRPVGPTPPSPSGLLPPMGPRSPGISPASVPSTADIIKPPRAWAVRLRLVDASVPLGVAPTHLPVARREVACRVAPVVVFVYRFVALLVLPAVRP